ncbi:hypothetical protein D3C86_1632740 [compost metagenome]
MRHAARFTDGCHDHVCLFGGGNGFVDHHLGRARIDDHFRTVEVEEVQVVDDLLVMGQVGALGVDHPRPLADRAADAVIQGDRLRRHAGGGPTAHHVDLGIGQRADQGDGALLLQG